jgi:hypothetical protein
MQLFITEHEMAWRRRMRGWALPPTALIPVQPMAGAGSGRSAVAVSSREADLCGSGGPQDPTYVLGVTPADAEFADHAGRWLSRCRKVRSAAGALAHGSPLEEPRPFRRARLRAKAPQWLVRSIPDGLFDELFAQMRSDRSHPRPHSTWVDGHWRGLPVSAAPPQRAAINYAWSDGSGQAGGFPAVAGQVFGFSLAGIYEEGPCCCLMALTWPA